MQTNAFPMVREVPYMGVIWVVYEASKRGFTNGHPDWCNLGQGQPEVGEMTEDLPRINTLLLKPEDHAYGPVGGTLEVREAIAQMINRLYRQGKMPYTADNVSFAAGGRLALTRLFGIVADGARIAYKNPDYTAYEDYFYGLRGRCSLYPIETTPQEGFSILPKRLTDIIRREKINCFVMSNPCNPTGVVVEGEALRAYIETARQENCLMGFDEFYSHFIYDADGNPAPGPISALQYVEDVDKDPVVVFDGLTKSFRYPGWRAGWAVGPKHIIDQINRAASAIDGGPSMITQRAALAALEEKRVDITTCALRKTFAQKRRVMLEELKNMGIEPAMEPNGTFYIWASIEKLPEPIRNADDFFFACLDKKVLTVPGHFFDIRPNRNRPDPEPLQHWVRFSYGPDIDTVKRGLDRIREVIKAHQ